MKETLKAGTSLIAITISQAVMYELFQNLNVHGHTGTSSSNSWVTGNNHETIFMIISRKLAVIKYYNVMGFY